MISLSKVLNLKDYAVHKSITNAQFKKKNYPKD